MFRQNKERKVKKFMMLSFGLICISTHAQQADSDPFSELDSEIKTFEAQGSPEDMEKFHQWKDDYLAEYQKFRVEHFNKLDDIRDKLMGTWGEVETSDQSKYVEYGEDNKTKTVLDFEKNEIRISVLSDSDTKDKANLAQNQLEQLLEKDSINDGESQTSVIQSLVGTESDVKEVQQLFDEVKDKAEVVKVEVVPEKILAAQITEIQKQTEAQYQQVDKIFDMKESQKDIDDPKVLEEDNAKIKAEIAQIQKQEKQRIERLKKQTKTLNAGTDKREALTDKKITTYTIPLKNKKMTDRAKPFFTSVKQESKRFELSPSLVLAVIHTESHFNPKAQSHIPAYGLMQIVPTTAGVDVNRFLFKKDAPMSVNHLYQANKNIEAGAAYIHILFNRYLKKIENPKSRLYCAIAAYNTGSGNVAKTFNTDGSRNVTKAARIINNMSPEEVYAQLLSSLPYEETRKYLEKVTSRRTIYEFLDAM
jgi:membrane-bound lytic murein transglycosylase C